MTTAKSYRLGKADERDVRWGLSQDIKGDVGIRSGFESFLNQMNLRSNLRTWTPKDPPRVNGRIDLSEHDGQAILCDGSDRRTQLTYEMSEEILGAASEIRRVWSAFEEIADQLWVLDIRYKREQVGGLEAFEDLGALVMFTKGASKCHQRECGLRNGDPGIVGSLQALSHRIRTKETIEDAITVAVDHDLWLAIFVEADARLSEACRAYVEAAKRTSREQRLEKVANLARRKRAR